MTSDQPGVPPRDDAATTARGARRPRRAVRTAGTVGTDESVLRTTVPAATSAPSARATAAQRGPERSGDVDAGRVSTDGHRAAGLDGPAVPFRSRDDSDVGWGDATDSNDDRLRRDRPPHW